MCGQFSVVGKMDQPQQKFMSDMFILDSLRGPDSCGLTTVNKDTERVTVFKRAIPAQDFIDLGGYKRKLTVNESVMMGHNRWATAGVVNSANAHPFTRGHITGQHNGTLIGQWRLPDSKTFVVDSENIMYSIMKIGIEATWKLIDGAAALMWWDAKESTFNMIRNSERPLFFCYSKNLNQMYAGSEKFMLLAALERNHIDVHKVETLPVNTLYAFKLDLKNLVPKEVVKCTTKKLEALPYRPSYNTGSRVGYNFNNQAIGKKIDFQVVDTTASSFGGTLYELECNITGDNYYMETYSGTAMKLKIDDCRTGVVSSVYGGESHISIASVRDDSQFEAVSDSVVEEAEEAEEKATLEMCAWCSSPTLSSEIVISSEGESFCEECSELADVSRYVMFPNKQQLSLVV